MRKIVVRIILAIAALSLCIYTQDINSVVRYTIGGVTSVVSFTLMLISRRQLGKSFSVVPEAKELVVHGLYAIIQHPMYVFLDVGIIGLIIVTRILFFLVPLGLLVLLQIVQGQKEEELLSAKYGDVYKSYAVRTWL